MRPLLRYHGGKWKLAPWLLEHFPPHRIYTEAFGGGASVLLRKPRVYSEVYNDLDEDIVTVFRVAREHPAALEAALRLTPFSRVEFRRAYEPAADLIERARRVIVRSYMGFGSASLTRPVQRTGFRSRSDQSGTTPAQDWRHYPDHFARLVTRLQGVVIECRPAVEILRGHDTPETLHYVDPPYVHSTRCFRQPNQGYVHEMSDDDHRELARVLHGLRGMVAISGYPSALYDDELFPEWRRYACTTLKSSNRASVPAAEVLWLNDAAARALDEAQRQCDLFDQRRSTDARNPRAVEDPTPRPARATRRRRAT